MTLSTVFARKLPTVRDVWLGLLNLIVCTVPAAAVGGAFFLFKFIAADAWPSTILFMVTLILGSCSLRLTLTNQQKADTTEDIDDMSDGTSTTNTLQLRAESLAAAEVDHGFIPCAPSDVSVCSDVLRI